MKRITILGCGSFGISLGVMADKYGHEVTIWSVSEETISEISSKGMLESKLPDVSIPTSIHFKSDICCVKDCEILILAVPSKAIREVAAKAAPYIKSHTVLVNVAKGLDDKTYKRLSQVIAEECPNNPIVVLSGPSHAEEIALGMPTTVVVSCGNKKYAEYIQDELSNDGLRIYVNDDTVGCELGGAFKNIIALCAGICDGMGYGDNTKAALMTRGITEIARLGVALGARVDTFAGLTGIGDLIVTCTSMHSRNRRAGILIGQGMNPQEAIAKIGTVEGYASLRPAYELSLSIGVDMPIIQQLNDIIYNGKDIKSALKNLMGRPNKHEVESLNWLAGTCMEIEK